MIAELMITINVICTILWIWLLCVLPWQWSCALIAISFLFLAFCLTGINANKKLSGEVP